MNAPDGIVKRDGTPVMILAEGSILSRGYKVNWQSADERYITYRAVKDGQFYLVKEVNSSDREAVKTLEHEQFVLEQFSHPGIQQSIERFKENGWQYLVLEYIGGTGLDRIVSPNSLVFMGENLLFNWAEQLYDLFAYLQLEKSDGIYGDTLVKKVVRSPRNIVRDREGKIHLIDIGISSSRIDEKASMAEKSLLQPLAAPEFYEGRETDERSDVFTLGAIFYYLLSNGQGRNINTGRYLPIGNINRNISPQLEALIMKSLQEDPDDRFPSIEAMKVKHHLINSMTSTEERNAGIRKKLHPLRFAIPAACTALTIVLVFIAISARKPAERATRQSGAVTVAGVPSLQAPADSQSMATTSLVSTDPMLYTSQHHDPGQAVPSTAPSPPLAMATSPSPAHSVPLPSQQNTAPPMLSSSYYPKGAPQTAERHGATPSEIPPQRVETVKNEAHTKEEKLALLLKMNANDLEPAKETYISSENDYSISVPSGYYLVKKKGKNNALFAAFDDRNEESSLRMILITTSFVPDMKVEAAIASYKLSLMTSGAALIDEKQINTKGGESLLYQAYSFTYVFGPPPQFNVDQREYIHQDLNFAHPRTGKAYRMKFCAPKDSFSMYDHNEFESTLRSLHFTISGE